MNNTKRKLQGIIYIRTYMKHEWKSENLLCMRHKKKEEEQKQNKQKQNRQQQEREREPGI